MFGILGSERVLRVERDEPWGHALVEPRWEPLARRLEARALEQPQRYRRRVAQAAALGSAVVAAALVLLVALAAAIIAFMAASRHVNGLEIKLVLLLALAGYGIAASLWVAFPAPEGRAVTPEEAPALFHAIERVRVACDGPRPHAVLIDDAFNAGIVQRPRLGPFGLYRNYLVLGLPLLQALSPAEFESVVAHEFGHLVGGDGKLGARVYRARTRWLQLSLRMADGWAAAPLRRFFRWYGPWFAAYSFALARAQEYAADRIAATVTSARIAADALVRVAEGQDRFGRHWQRVWDESETAPEPATRPFAGATAHLLAPPCDATRAAVAAELTQRTGTSDTHPALADRLAALDQAARPLPPPETSAASALLGPLATTIAAEFDAAWWGQARASFERAHAEHAEQLARLSALEAHDPATLDRDGAWQKATLSLTHRDNTEAMAVLRSFTAAYPDHAGGSAALAERLLERDDDEGVAWAERTIALEPDLDVAMALRVVAFASRTGAGSPLWEDRLTAAEARAARASIERAELRPDSRFVAPDPRADALAAFAEELATLRFVRRVWIARRVLEHSHTPQHVAVVEPRGTHDALAAREAVAQASAALGDTLCVAVVGRANRWLRDAVCAVSPTPLPGGHS